MCNHQKNIIKGLYSKHEKSYGERDNFTLLDFYNDHKLYHVALAYYANHVLP